MAQADALIASAEFLGATCEREQKEICFLGGNGGKEDGILGRNILEDGSCQDWSHERNNGTGNLIMAASSAAIHATVSERAATSESAAVSERGIAGEKDRKFTCTNPPLDVVPEIRQNSHSSDPTMSQQSVPSTPAPDPDTASSTRVTSSVPNKESDGFTSSNGNITDSAKADEFYRAGSFTLDQGRAVDSIPLFRQALALCPPSKRTAVSKIEKQIDLAQKFIDSTTKSQASSPKRFSPAPIPLPMRDSNTQTNSSTDPTHTSSLQPPQIPFHTDGAGCEPPQSNSCPSNEVRESDSEPHVSEGSQVVQSGTREDAEAADFAYRAGVEALERQEYLEGIVFLRQAASLCPIARKSASAKIQNLIREAEMLCKE